jgi:predicted GIY-YIG superfamily endonuclease
MSNKIHGVYFLTDGAKRRSYCGYSTCISKRYRVHALKLAASAKCTKSFTGCEMWIKIEGFPTHNTALSMEWFSKRRRLKVHQSALDLNTIAPHPRISKFLAPLLHVKFRKLRANLIVYVRDPDLVWSKCIQEHYNVTVKQMEPPFKPEHVARPLK